jgi:hypothetical protein
MIARPMPLLRQQLIRLLAVNLLIGIGAALLMLGGLMAFNPLRLRELILADRAGGVALALLLFGFVITFGSSAMGSAIMMLDGQARNKDGGKTQPAPVRVRS